jgi:glycosyltransferase involved in cell wall biosynthesis
MNRVIVFSPFDCEFYDSTRTHHVVDQLSRHCNEVYLFHRRLPVAGSPRWPGRIARFLRLERQARRDGNVVRVAVTPLFARGDGTSLALLQVADPYAPVKSSARRLAMGVLGMGGWVLDVFCIPSYLYAYARQGAPRAEVVLAQGPWEFAVARVLKLIGRASRIAYDDLDYVPGSYSSSPLKRKLMEALENYSIRSADIVVSVGELLADLRRRMGREVAVVANGADIQRFSRARVKRPHPPTLIYVGSVLAWSGVDLAIAALPALRAKVPDARLIVIGHSTQGYRAQLEALCDLHGVRECVHFLGKKSADEIVAALAEADVGLAVFRPVELRKYAFSLKVIEYMAAGLPVLTTAGTQSEAVVARHGCGLAIPYSVEAIAEAATQLLMNEPMARSMADCGARASADYDWDILIGRRLYPLLESSACAPGLRLPGSAGRSSSASRPGGE